MSTQKKVAGLIERNPWISLVRLPDFGRGLISAVEIPKGTVIHKELPIVSCPPLQQQTTEHDGSWCNVCLLPGGSGKMPACCTQGDMMMNTGYGPQARWRKIERMGAWEPLLQYSAMHGEKFPLLVARLACMRIGRRVCHGIDDGGFLDDRDMASLCYATMSQVPRAWEESHQALLECFSDVPEVGNMITLDWYTDMMRRVHINAFRVDLIDILGLENDYAAALKRMFVEQESQESCGSAVYLVSSLFNHSCTPNVEPTFPHNNHIVEIKALRKIERHEQLCISYIDSVNLSYEERQKKLFHGYGFRCQCEKCMEEKT